MSYIEPTAMCCLSCFILFWNTKYNTPRTFCLANYSVVFCDLCHRHTDLTPVTAYPLTTQTAYEPLGATPWTNTLPFLIPVDWLVSYGSQHHLLLFHCPVFLAARRTMFFPIHQLCCYNHRSYQWSLPRGSEQACLNELLLAELCRHTSFGCVTTVILRKRQAAYRMLNHPWILIQLHILDHA